MRRNKKLWIIKYWSSTLIDENFHDKLCIDYKNIENHWSLIDKVQDPVIIVSSGAVAFWKIISHGLSKIQDETIRKRIYAAIWNPKLSLSWSKAMPSKILLQSLLTHRDLIDDFSKQKISEIIQKLLLYEDLLIQVNDNDFLSDEELLQIRWWDFWDNDKITSLLAILCSDFFDEVKIVLNTSSDWVLRDWKTISHIKLNEMSDLFIENLCDVNSSILWTWWMSNKLKAVRELLQRTSNCTVNIVNWKNHKELENLFKHKSAWTLITR